MQEETEEEKYPVYYKVNLDSEKLYTKEQVLRIVADFAINIDIKVSHIMTTETRMRFIEHNKLIDWDKYPHHKEAENV